MTPYDHEKNTRDVHQEYKHNQHVPPKKRQVKWGEKKNRDFMISMTFKKNPVMPPNVSHDQET